MSSNLWANRWRNYKDGYDRHENALLEKEASDAEQMPVYTCTEEGCDGEAHYRPGVGGWWCIECGELSKF